MNVDVAIVGTGPAGAMAAYQLAGSGLKIAVLESAVLPRPKPCGGLMPGWVKPLTQLDLDPLIDHRVSRFDYSLNFKQEFTRQHPTFDLLLADRAKFDSGILQMAMKRGGQNLKLYEQFRVSAVHESTESVVLHSKSGDKVCASAVIGADGATSKVARSLGLGPTNRLPTAIDAAVRVTPDFYQTISNRVIFNYFFLPAGYGWIFPKGNNMLACGVGSWADNKYPLKPALHRYLSLCIPAKHCISIEQHGHPIPAYEGPRKIATPRVCLVGDAAGLVDPVTGEGIRYALHSGMIAAKTVERVLLDMNSETPEGLSCMSYEKEITNGPGVALERLHRMAVLPFKQAPEFYYKKFIIGGQTQPHYGGETEIQGQADQAPIATEPGEQE